MSERQQAELGLPAPVTTARGQGPDGSEVFWHVAEETPVAIMLNSAPWAVMMASPSDLEDFAAGIAITEKLVPAYADIAGILVMPVDGGLCADIATTATVSAPARNVEGRTGCGLCGVTDIADVVALPEPKGAPAFALTAEAAGRAFRSLAGHQPLNALCHSVHAAGWCAPDGTVLMAREDVGRHNALDKLIGALLRQGLDPTQGFAVMSSRASFELVRKCVAAGIPHLAAISAPTGLALNLAGKAGMTLAAAQRGSVVMFPPTKE